MKCCLLLVLLVACSPEPKRAGPVRVDTVVVREYWGMKSCEVGETTVVLHFRLLPNKSLDNSR